MRIKNNVITGTTGTIGTKDGVTGKHRNMERLINLVFLIVFPVLVIIQAAIFLPSFKWAAVGGDAYMGEPLGREEYLYRKSSLELTLLSFDSYPALKVLVNGEEKASFTGKTVNLTVLDGDVVELDGSGTNANSIVEVTKAGPGVNTDYAGSTFTVGREVLKIFKMRLSPV